MPTTAAGQPRPGTDPDADDVLLAAALETIDSLMELIATRPHPSEEPWDRPKQRLVELFGKAALDLANDINGGKTPVEDELRAALKFQIKEPVMCGAPSAGGKRTCRSRVPAAGLLCDHHRERTEAELRAEEQRQVRVNLTGIGSARPARLQVIQGGAA